MVILGLERPVEYGSRQIFDPTMANMVLNALNNYIQAMKEDYLRGREDLKEFNKNFGDFFSPILKDMEWYDLNVTGATRDLINNLYAYGIDPLRSAEGRAAISRWINNMPTGKINRLKESAMAANEYLKNKGVLEAAGKYSDDFERFANGGILLKDWDTINNGMWTRTSPAELKSLKELTESWFNNRTAHDLDKAGVESFGIAYDPRYDYTGFTYGDLLGIAAGQTPGWNGGVYADYYRQLAKNKLGPNATPEQIEAQLQQDIATANKEWMINPSKSVNELYLQDLKNRQAQIIAGMRGGRRGNGSGDADGEEDNRTTFMDRLQQNVDLHVEDKLFGRKTVGESIASFADYWDKMAKSYESRGRVIGTKDVSYTEPINTPSSYPSPMGGGLRFGRTEKLLTKKQNVYDQKDNEAYNKAVYERDRWLRFGNTGKYQVSKYDTSKEASDVRKIMAEQASADKKLQQIYLKANAKGLGSITTEDKKFLEQYAKNKKLVDGYKQNDILRTMYKVKGNSPAYLGKPGQTPGTTTTEDLKRRSSKFWDYFKAESLSDHLINVLLNMFDGDATEVTDPNLPNKYKELSLNSNYSYAPIRQSNIAGSGRFKYNDIHNKFNRWLHSDGTTLMSFSSNNVLGAILPVGGRIGGLLDIMKHPLITKEQFMEFYNKSGASKYGTPEDVAKKLGLGVHKKSLTYKGKDDVLHETDTYYSVPITATFDPSSYRDINVKSDKLEFGASEASKSSIDSENQALLAQLLLEAALDMLN